MIAADDALYALAEFDERKSRIVELRVFGGLSVAETAGSASGEIEFKFCGGKRNPRRTLAVAAFGDVDGNEYGVNADRLIAIGRKSD